MSERGFYAVIEGSDGVGKSTQFQMLQERVEKELNESVVFVREPGSTELAQQLRAMVLDPESNMPPIAELCLFTAGRVDLWDKVILPALNDDRIVISDRNWYSGLAYQGSGDSVPASVIEGITKLALPERYVTPDLTVVYDISEQERNRRIDSRAVLMTSFERRGDEYFNRVQDAYRHIVRDMGAVGLDASGAREDVAEMTWNIFSQHLEDFRQGSKQSSARTWQRTEKLL
jgi:dTMP kinase